MGNDDFLKLCKQIVVDYFNEMWIRQITSRLLKKMCLLSGVVNVFRITRHLLVPMFLMECIMKSPTMVISRRLMLTHIKSGIIM